MMWHVVMTVVAQAPRQRQKTRVTIHGLFDAETRSGAFDQAFKLATDHFGSQEVAVDFLVVEPETP